MQVQFFPPVLLIIIIKQSHRVQVQSVQQWDDREPKQDGYRENIITCTYLDCTCPFRRTSQCSVRCTRLHNCIIEAACKSRCRKWFTACSLKECQPNGSLPVSTGRQSTWRLLFVQWCKRAEAKALLDGYCCQGRWPVAFRWILFQKFFYPIVPIESFPFLNCLSSQT